MSRTCLHALAIVASATFLSDSYAGHKGTNSVLAEIGSRPAIVCVLDIPDRVGNIIDLTKAEETTVYFQSDDREQVATVRAAAESAGLLGNRIFVDGGRLQAIHLANNIADCMLVASSAASKIVDRELLRVLRPQATAFIDGRRLTKPVPDGIDDWSHPSIAIVRKSFWSASTRKTEACAGRT